MKKVYIFWVGFVSLASYYFLSFLHYDFQILSDELILMVNFMIISSICVLKCITFIFYVFIFVSFQVHVLDSLVSNVLGFFIWYR